MTVPAPPARLHVAIVAPSLSILGGQAVQAQRLLAAWANDPEITARLVPINPFPDCLAPLARIKYLRTVITQLLYWPLLLRELRRADVVHVFSASYFSFLLAPLPAVLIAKALARPVLINYRSGQALDHLKGSRISRAILGSVSEVVVPSQFLAEVFASFGIHSRIIPNVVDRHRFRFRCRDRLHPWFLSTRNFEPLYNVICTLRAFERIQKRYPDARLTLVGRGRDEAKLRRYVREHDLRNVTFAGAVAPDQIWRYYAAADIYLQTPNIDNMPSSVLEALASGVPVVSTEAGGVPAILTHGVHGLLAPLDDDASIAAQVIRLLEEPRLGRELAAAGLAATDAFTWERVRGQWATLYRSLLTAAAAAVPTVRPA